MRARSIAIGKSVEARSQQMPERCRIASSRSQVTNGTGEELT
jgi:hypothetical protein